MIAINTFLLAMALLSMQASGVERAGHQNDCHKTTTPEAQRFKERAERLFLAYTNSEVKSYKVDLVDCGEELVVFVLPTGNDARIGGVVTISYSKDDMHITISPGM